MKQVLTSCIAFALLVGGASAHAKTIEMKVYGMVCGFCAQGIEKILRENPATQEVFVSLENKLVVVETSGSRDISDAALRAAIKDAGYEVKEIARTERSLGEIRTAVTAAK